MPAYRIIRLSLWHENQILFEWQQFVRIRPQNSEMILNFFHDWNCLVPRLEQEVNFKETFRFVQDLIKSTTAKTKGGDGT